MIGDVIGDVIDDVIDDALIKTDSDGASRRGAQTDFEMSARPPSPPRSCPAAEAGTPRQRGLKTLVSNCLGPGRSR